MAQTLTNSDPELDPAIAYEIALNEASTYVQGYTRDARQDPGFKTGGGGNNNGPYNDFQAYEGIFKRSEKKQRATESLEAAQDIIQMEEVGTPLRGIAQELGIIREYQPVEYVEPFELSQSILNYRNEVKNGTAGFGDLFKHIGDNIEKAFGQLGTLYANHIEKTESVNSNRVEQSLKLIFGDLSFLSPDDPVAAYANDPEIISRFLEHIPDNKKVDFGIKRGTNGLLGFVDKEDREWDLWDARKNLYIYNNMKKTVKYLTEEITKGGADIKKYYDEKANEVYSYLEENPYALMLAGDILANDPELSGIKAISQAMTMVENAKINYGETFNDEYSIFTQDEDTEEFVRKVSGSIADLEIYKLIEKDDGWFRKSKIESEEEKGRASKDYIARIDKNDWRSLRFDPVDGSFRATFLDDDKQRTNIVIPITGKNASKILPKNYVPAIQKVAKFLDPDSFFKGEDLRPDGTRTINFMGVDYVMEAVPYKGSLIIEINGFDSQGNHYTEEDLYEDYVAFVHRALAAKSKSYLNNK